MASPSHWGCYGENESIAYKDKRLEVPKLDPFYPWNVMALIHLPKTKIESIYSLSLFGYTNGYGDTDGAGYFEEKYNVQQRSKDPLLIG